MVEQDEQQEDPAVYGQLRSPSPNNLIQHQADLLPPNTTSHLQPIDVGINQNVKLHYRKCMLRNILIKMDECNTARELVKRLTLLDVIHWLQIAWLKVEESTIAKRFAKTNFVHTNSTTESSDVSADADDEEEWDESDLIPLRQVIPNVEGPPQCGL